MLRLVRISGATDPTTGLVIMSLKVPGTFGGIDPSQLAWSGRGIEQAEAWFGIPVPGDYCSGFSLVDQDGLITPPGTVLSSWVDPGVPSEQQGLYMDPKAKTIIPPFGEPRVPSGMYIVVSFQKVSPSSDTIYANMEWDDFT